MDQSVFLLLSATFSVGFIHTLAGPDHYLPFIALSGARGWAVKKTMGVTLLCGLGHIGSAVLIALLAMSMGFVFDNLSVIESFRGQLASWFLISFGLVYALWGLKRAVRKQVHSHGHGLCPHEGHDQRRAVSWVLFLIFIFGPCEPLIPLILYPEILGNGPHVLAVVLTFGLASIITMLLIVGASLYGVKRFFRIPLLERFGNALAGGVLCSCGLAMAFLGL